MSVGRHRAFSQAAPTRDAPAGFEAQETLERSVTTVTFIVARGANERYVCKRLSMRARDDADARQRLADEGRLLAVLAGRGAPAWILDGEDASGPFVVMRRVEGKTLATWIEKPTDAAWTARAALATLRALMAVHEATDPRGPLGVVHADVSPTNVLVHDDASRAVLVDFELAQWRDARASSPGERGTFGGTLLYAAPELARGERIDARADLFSAALSILHAACGAAPRSRDLAVAALLVDAGERAVDTWARAAARARPLGSSLERALVACAAFDRDARPASAREALARANTAP